MNNKQIALLILLTLISTVQVFLTAVLKYSRLNVKSTYIASTSVVMSETIKALVAYFFLILENGFKKANNMLYLRAVVHWKTTLLLLVPSLLYALQNTLLIVAMTNLDAAIYTVTYQFKIVITALLSMVMLHKKLNGYQWLGILLLIPGVSLVQYDSEQHIHHENTKPLLGFICLIFCSFSSGFAGVYFEKILKSTPKNNLWIQSIQLCFGSAVLACFLCLKDYSLIMEKGFFYGYDKFTWYSILLNAASGITIAAVVKVADNIVKGLSTSISMVLSCFISIMYFGFKPTRNFYIGTVLVFVAVILYTVFPSLKRSKTQQYTV